VTKLVSLTFPNTICYLPDANEEFSREFLEMFGVLERVQQGGSYSLADRIPFADQSVDVVLSSGVLEHVREHSFTEAALIKEIHRILKPGGYFFVWNLPSRMGFVELVNSWLGRSVHPWKYTRAQLLELFQAPAWTIKFIDQHEIFHLAIRDAVSNLIGPVKAWQLDYVISKLPVIRRFAQHFTLIVRKIG